MTAQISMAFPFSCHSILLNPIHIKRGALLEGWTTVLAPAFKGEHSGH